jgi:uncharacterized protein YfaS (alpha-2-macroglobulin family)
MQVALLLLLALALPIYAGEPAEQVPHVESFSPQGTVKGVRQVAARFSGQMAAFGDPRLADPFDVDCPASGKGRWADGRNWVYDFEADLPGGVRCGFSLKADLKALNGQPVGGERRYNFDTGGPAVRASLPYEGNERIDENQVFVLALDAPATSESIQANARCDIAGLTEQIPVRVIDGEERDKMLAQRRLLGHAYYRLLWKSGEETVHQVKDPSLEKAESQLAVLQCRRTIPPETQVRLIWGKGIAAPSGVTTSAEQALAFKTRPSFTARFECRRTNAKADCLPMLPMTVVFSAPVPAEAAAKVRIVGAEGEVYAPDPIDQGKTPFVENLSFAGPFPEKARFTVEVPKGLADDAGRVLENADRFPLAVATDELPPLAKFPGEFGILELKEGGILPVTLRNLEPSVASLQLAPGQVTAEPKELPGKMRRVVQDDGEIVGWIEKVKKAVELRGEWSEKTGENGKRIWKELTGSQSVFEPGQQTEALSVPKPNGAKAFEVVGIPLKKPGFYVVELASPKLGAALLGEQTPRYVPTTALVTNLAVHFKWGRESSVVWVTTLDKGQPVADAEVRVSDYCSHNELWRGKTDADGLARIGSGILPNPHDGSYCPSMKPALFVSARKDDDLSFTASSWNQGITPSSFGLPTYSYGGPQIAHTVFDRTLLRAGETVSMKHFLRRHTMAGFSVPEDFPLDKLVLTHEGSGQRYEFPLVLDAGGVAESSWAVPQDAKLGVYQVAFMNSKQKRQFASGSFRVEQYRVPTMKAAIQPPAEPLVNVKETSVDLFVGYLSGGGAAHAPVKLRTLVRPKAVSFKGYEDFRFGGEEAKEGMQASQPFSLEDYFRPYGRGSETGQTPAQVLPLTLDNAGAARAAIPGLPKVSQAHEVVAELEYEDANGELLSVSNRVPLWPAKINLGIRTEGWVASKDQLRFRVVALDLAGKPVANRPVSVEIFAKTAYSYRKRLVGGFYAYEDQTETKRLKPTCKGMTNAQGLLLCEIKPGMAGQAIIQARAEDELGNPALSNTQAWVSTGDDWWFESSRGDRMDVLPEKKEYERGETARFQVRMPFRQAKALVTVEREGVVESFVRDLSGQQPVVEIPVKDNYAPNVYVSVLAVRGRAAGIEPWRPEVARKLGQRVRKATALVDLAKPAYRLGAAQIDVGWTPNRLQVQVQPDREVYKVRDQAKVTVSVVRADGGNLPAGSEIALAAVDEGLLELKPNDSWRLLEKMMGRRGIEVHTSTAQMQVVGKRHYGRKAVPQGGGGGRQAARELFDTLLLWRGRIPLDNQGRAEIDVPLNDSLTAFRLVAVAHGGAGLFGTGHSTIRTTQDLMLHSGLPPLVREGDRFQALFTLRNASERTVSAKAWAKVRPENPRANPATLAALPPQALNLAPGEAQTLAWELNAPVDASQLLWEVGAEEQDGAARDTLKVKQQVIPVHPVRIYQATLAQIEQPFRMVAERPADSVPGRGGLRVTLRAKLGDGLDGVREYMSLYSYICLEQQLSRAVALRDKALWDSLANRLPNYMDKDGLLKYFATDWLEGSDTLTAYVLAIAHEAGWTIPDHSLERLKQGLKGFVEGRIVRDSALPTADLSIRKLAAIEALSRYGDAKREMLDSIAIEPNLWPTSAVLDWLNVLQRLEDVADKERRLDEAQQIIRSRVNFQGTVMTFSTEQSDALWWLMISSDVNAARAVLSLLEQPSWREDMPRLVRGALSRQQKGHWNTTTANAWGVLAMEKFSAAFESVPVAGRTTASLSGEEKPTEWKADTKQATLDFPWPQRPAPLTLAHQGQGKPWAIVQSLAALPLKQPLFTGYRIRRTVSPVERKQADVWSRGDVARVRLELEAQSDMAWVVVDDPIPAGAAVLGTGLGRDAQLLTRGEQREGWVWPAFEERRFDAFRAYYRFVPKGKWTVEYTVRFNNPGRFELPATRVEAMYAPEMLGELPNAAVEIGAK